MDHILITGLTVEMVIGVHRWERHAPRRLTLDLELGVDTRAAAASDDVADAVDYAAVCDTVRTVCAASAPALLERLLADIEARLFADFAPLRSLRITAHKAGAVPGAGIALRIYRQRPD